MQNDIVNIVLIGIDVTKNIISHIIYYDYQSRGKFYNMQLIRDGVIICYIIITNTNRIKGVCKNFYTTGGIL